MSSELRSGSCKKTIPVESSVLESVCYDPETLVLILAFHSGSVHEYADVPEGVYRDLLDAPSKGKFFRQHILGVYDARRVL